MKGIAKKYRIEIYSMLTDLLRDNVPLFDGLGKIHREGQGVYSKSFVKSVSEIQESMKDNSSLASALDGLIPEKEVSMVDVAESSGRLADGLDNIKKLLLEFDEIKSKVVSAVMTPLIMFAVTLGVIAGYATNVFPTFVSFLPVSRWPTATQVLYNFGNSLAGGLWINILAVMAILAVAIAFAARTVTGSIRNNVLDKLIPFNYVREIEASLFLSNMSSLLDSKVPFNDGLQLLSNTKNRWLASHIKQIEARMKAGMEYKNALDTGLLNKKILLTIAIYSDLPNFADVMKKLAEEANKGVHQKIAGLAAGLKVVSLLILAGVVIWIFVAVFALVDSLSSSM